MKISAKWTLGIILIFMSYIALSGNVVDTKASEFYVLIEPDRLEPDMVQVINNSLRSTLEDEELSVFVLEEKGEDFFEELNRNHEDIGGIISLSFIEDDTAFQETQVELFHYPFDPITEHHVISPTYSFKFSSDSALLGIQLEKAFAEYKASMRLAESCNEHFIFPLLQKWTGITTSANLPLTSEKGRELGKKIGEAIIEYYHYNDNAVVGLITDQARDHASPDDIEIRLYPYIYPDKDFSNEEAKEREEQMETLEQKTTPFDSGVYYFTDLDTLTPYDITMKNTAEDASPYWEELDTASFVTSSLRGIARTVPSQYDNYEPLSYSRSDPFSKPEGKTYDYVIESPTIIDGSHEAEKYVADVGIQGKRIAAIGDLKELPRQHTIDGSGKYLTPGFIDIHSHADRNALDVPYAPSHVRQGITTVLGGNCSFSPLGIGAFLREVEENGLPVNMAMLVGNRPIREEVLGRRKGKFSYNELYRQKELVDLAMEEGAFGMSTGLIYSISEEAFAWELAELSKQMKPYGGFYASHIRGETDEVLDAVREAIHIGNLAEVPVQISHMKVLRKRNWGKMEEYLNIMEDARERGIDVTGDQYPWEASGPAAHYHLYQMLEQEAIRNNQPEVVRLKDMPGDFEKYSGKNLVKLLEGEDMTPEELIEELDLEPDSEIYATYLCIGDEDIVKAMKDEKVMVCTDARMVSLEAIEESRVTDNHPRAFRTYHQFFAHYIRDREIIPWELAVYKCTGLPAERMGLDDRGRIKVGTYADLVLFDPDKIDPVADFRDQKPEPVGFDWVFTNGVLVMEDGEMTKEQPGKSLYAGDRRKP